MEKVLKYTKANVCVKDKETGVILFKDSNRFVDSGRELIVNVFIGTVIMNPLYWACDLGDDSEEPDPEDNDLAGYLDITGNGLGSVGVYPIQLAGEGSGVHFQFEFTNSTGSSQIIRELGLFYRPDPDITTTFPVRLPAPASPGYMIARLKTTFSSITVGNGKVLTIDWKIIF